MSARRAPGEPIDLPRSPRKESQWEIAIDEMSRDGRGVGYLPARVGPQREEKHFRFLVRRALPGDRVRVEVEHRRSERIECKIVEMIEPSSIRIEPRCAHFGRRDATGEGCGGCTYQSLSYRHQLRIKERIVRRLLQEADLDPGKVQPVLGQANPWRYRNTMEFSFGDTAEREFALGMHPAGYQHEIVNLNECHLQSTVVSDLVPAIRSWAMRHGVPPYINSRASGFLRTVTIREADRTGDRMVNLMTTEDDRVPLDEGNYTVPATDVVEWFADWLVDWASQRDADLTSVIWTQKRARRGEPTEWRSTTLRGASVLHEQLELPGDESLSFEIAPRAFFQTNTRQAEVLYEEVLDRAKVCGGPDGEYPASALDLYCGTGTISLVMATRVERVVGVELQEEAVANAKRNAANNGIDNASFICADVGNMLDDKTSRAERFALGTDHVPPLAIVDPPRAGLNEPARRHLIELSPTNIVYVSCNPEALARDLAALQEAGYQYGKIQPVDMFPQTYHIECVTRLSRR
jgi:23S rRNA (uracil1939-C5)-methyltransferase